MIEFFTSSENFLDKVPLEIMLYIVEYLLPEERAKLVRVSQHYNALLKAEWKRSERNRLKRHFPAALTALEFGLPPEELGKLSPRDYVNCFEKANRIYSPILPLLQRQLFYLVKEGDLDGIKRLREQFSLNDLLKAKDKNQCRIFTWAHTNRHQHVLDYFYQEFFQTAASKNEQSSLLNFAIFCHQPIDQIKELMNTYIIENELIKDNKPVFAAVEVGYLEIVKLILQDEVNRPAMLTAQNENDKTLLHFAAENGHVEVAKLLIEHGALLTAADIYGSTPLHLAAENGHVEVAKLLIEQLIEQEASVNVTDSAGITPLHLAAENGHVEVAKLLIERLIEQKAPVNAANRFGITPLHVAAENGHVEVAKLLIERLIEQEAPVNAANRFGITPLHVAAENGRVEVAQLLIEQGAKVNVCDNYGFRPLEKAMQNGHAEIQLLMLSAYESSQTQQIERNRLKRHFPATLEALEFGLAPEELAKLSARDYINCFAKVTRIGYQLDSPILPPLERQLFYLVKEGDLDGIKRLRQQFSLNHLLKAKDENQYRIFTWAHINQHQHVLDYFYQEFFQTAASKNEQSSLLDFAIFCHQPINKIKELMNTYSTEDKLIKDNKPVFAAVEAGYLEAVEWLWLQDEVNSSAMLTARNENDKTLLHLAAENGHVEVAKLLITWLIKQEASVNVTDSVGITPLHVAARKGYVEVAKLLIAWLIKQEASVNVTDRIGITPLHLAAENGYVEVVKLLIEQKAPANAANRFGMTPLHLAAEKGYVEVAKLLIAWLIEQEASVNVTDSVGITPLHVAAENGHVEVAKLLIERLIEQKAPVNAANRNGMTPLHVAARKGYVEIVQLLIKGEAPINATTHDNSITPLHVAAENGHVEVVKLLIKQGAEVNAANRNGITPIHLAAKNGHVEVVKLLIKQGAKDSATLQIGMVNLTPFVLFKSENFKQYEPEPLGSEKIMSLTKS